MMEFKELSGKLTRERVDMIQLWNAWIKAEDLRCHSFQGSMRWEESIAISSMT